MSSNNWRAKMLGDEPAFPVVGAAGAQQDFGGLTKREDFAKAALVAAIRSFGSCDPAGSAKSAVAHADALLAELAKDVSK